MKKKVAALTAFLLMPIFVFADVAFAEKEKSVCPAEFDPYDSSWVLVRAELDEEYFFWGRYFLYQPDLVLRIQRKIIETCRGFTISFLVDGREQLTWKVLFNGEQETHFLQNEDGSWIAGTAILHTNAENLVAGGKLEIDLYQGDKIVQVRAVPVPKDYNGKAAKAAKEKREKENKENEEDEDRKEK